MISTKKTETMAFNVSEQIKAKEMLISIGDVALKNVRTFKYLGHMIANNEKRSITFPEFPNFICIPKMDRIKTCPY